MNKNWVSACNLLSHQSVLRIEHTTDYDWEENSWEVKDIINNQIVHSIDFRYDRRDYEANKFYNETFCLEAESCYEFTMKDYYGDGMSDGGSYEIFYNGVSIMSGSGDFGYNKTSAMLFGDDCPPSSPSATPSPPSFSPSTTPSLSFSSPSATPSISPSPSLSSRPSMLHSSSPSVTPSVFRIDHRTDASYTENSWEVKDIITDTIIYSIDFGENDGGEYKANTLYSETFYLREPSCYVFSMKDLSGDGMSKGGYYAIFYNDELIMIGSGNFGYNMTSMLFGDDCQSVIIDCPTGGKKEKVPTFQYPSTGHHDITL